MEQFLYLIYDFQYFDLWYVGLHWSSPWVFQSQGCIWHQRHSFAEVWGTRLGFVDCVVFSLERLVINEKAKPL